MKKAIKKELVRPVNIVTLIAIIVLPILHYLSLGWMAKARFIEAIMAPCGDASFVELSAALTFVALRMAVVFLGPGFLAGWLLAVFISSRVDC
jgi:hypothetical protein